MAQQPPAGPPQPPGGYPPQPPSGGYSQPAYPIAPARPARPGSVTAAGVLLIVLGAFAAIGGAVVILGVVVGARVLQDLGGEFADVAGTATAIGVIVGVAVIVYAVFKIIAGARVIGLRNGWRITGIVLCAVAMVGWLVSLIGAFQGQNEDFAQFGVDVSVPTGPNIGGIILSAVFLAANLLTLILLARAGSAFRR